MVDVVSRRPAHLGYSFSCIRLLRCGRRRGHGHWGGLGTLSNAIFVQADFVASLRVPGSVPLRELGFRSTTKHSERRRLGNTRWSAASMMELGSVRMCSFWCRAGATFLGRETSGRSSGIPATTELLASMCGRRCERSRRFLSIRCCVTKKHKWARSRPDSCGASGWRWRFSGLGSGAPFLELSARNSGVTLMSESRNSAELPGLCGFTASSQEEAGPVRRGERSQSSIANRPRRFDFMSQLRRC